MHNGQVTMINVDSSGYKSMSRNRVSTDTGNNGYCMVIPCKSHRQPSSETYRGIVVADYQDRGRTVAMKPHLSFGITRDMRDTFDVIAADRDKVFINFDQSIVHSAGTGPFYDWERKWRYSYSCSNANFNEHHLSFFDEKCLIENQAYMRNHQKIPRSQLPTPNQPLLNWINWDGLFAAFNNNWAKINGLPKKTFCHMKVRAPLNTKVKATSYVHDVNHPYYPDEGQAPVMYGSREDCINSDGFVCIEVRPAKVIARDLDNVHNETLTRVKFTANSPILTVTSINQELLNKYSNRILTEETETSFEVCLNT